MFRRPQAIYLPLSSVYSYGMVDKARVFRMSIAGAFGGVIGHFWYIFLDRRFVGTTLKIIAKKCLFDQIVFAPLGIIYFFGLLGLMEGGSIKTIVSEIRQKGPEVMLVDWLVYPPAQFINFKFLPTRFRVLYDCFIAFGLDLYYSHIKYER